MVRKLSQLVESEPLPTQPGVPVLWEVRVKAAEVFSSRCHGDSSFVKQKWSFWYVKVF